MIQHLIKTGKQRLKYLRWWDILIITVIMFGSFILSSNAGLFMSVSQEIESVTTQTSLDEALIFTTAMNWQALIKQSLLLALTFVYLLFRGFDFSQWHFQVNGKSILKGLGLFIGLALIFEIYLMIAYYFQGYAFWSYSQVSIASLIDKLKEIDISLILYSMLNGFYEEIFFLGICLAVPTEKRTLAFIYSLFIRYSFHTYQGQLSALGIGLIFGGIYYYLYTRMEFKNLFPFMLAHTLTDIFGAGILSYFLTY